MICKKERIMKLLKTLIAAASLATGAVAAQSIEFTVHAAPGGPSDTVSRIIAKSLDDKNIIVANRPGAGGRIAIKQVLTGNAMVLATMSQIFVANPILAGDKLEYDIDRDLELIGLVASMPSVLICNKAKNINTVADLDRVSDLTFGFAGYGSSEHLATEVLFKKLKTSHRLIPYSRGGTTAIADMAGGSIDCMFANYPLVRGWTADRHFTFVMSSHELGLGIPTWRETYREDFPFQSYLGLVVSKQMPVATKQALTKNLTVIFKNPEFVSDLKNAGVFPTPGTDAKSIERGLKNNKILQDFIIKNNIKLN
jgi:tripartite-type tricarboxylate transporter receptor subunit TctC